MPGKAEPLPQEESPFGLVELVWMMAYTSDNTTLLPISCWEIDFQVTVSATRTPLDGEDVLEDKADTAYTSEWMTVEPYRNRKLSWHPKGVPAYFMKKADE